MIHPWAPQQSRISDQEGLAPPFLSAVRSGSKSPKARGAHCCHLQIWFGGLGDAHLGHLGDVRLPRPLSGEGRASPSNPVNSHPNPALQGPSWEMSVLQSGFLNSEGKVTWVFMYVQEAGGASLSLNPTLSLVQAGPRPSCVLGAPLGRLGKP